MVPDYISEKKMLELKGDVYPCMGCRSFLTPDRFTDAGVGNIANAGNYEPGKHKYYGRFNQGVVTINLVDIALSANKDTTWKPNGRRCSASSTKPPPSAAPNRQLRNDQHPRAAIHAAAGIFHIPQQAKSSPGRGALGCFTRWR